MNARFVPIEVWPGKPHRQSQRKNSPFRGSWGNTLTTLDCELQHLRATDILVQGYFRAEDVRLDGWPRAGASPSGPGVVVSFHTPNGDLSFPCDTYTKWPDNLRAIALALAALRAVSATESRGGRSSTRVGRSYLLHRSRCRAPMRSRSSASTAGFPLSTRSISMRLTVSRRSTCTRIPAATFIYFIC